MSDALESGYVSAGAVQMYWESRGSGGTPLVVVHGGFGTTSMFGDLLDRLAIARRVIAVEMQGHGHTADIERPFSWAALGDDLAAAIEGLGLPEADLMGYSLGAGASLCAAIDHPQRIRRLIVVSLPYKRAGWYPGVLEGMASVNAGTASMLMQSPLYAAYSAVAPDVSGFPALAGKTGGLLGEPYDWTDGVRALAMPTMLVYGDADSIPPSHAAEFFALLGGGRQDGGWDGAHVGVNRLAILPGLTHYDIVTAPALAAVVEQFVS